MKPADAKSNAVSSQNQPPSVDEKQSLSESDLRVNSVASEALPSNEHSEGSSALKNRSIKVEERPGFSIKDGKVALRTESELENEGIDRENADATPAVLNEEDLLESVEDVERQQVQIGGLEEKEEPATTEEPPSEQEKVQEPPKEESVEPKEETVDEKESKVENEPVGVPSEDDSDPDSAVAAESGAEKVAIEQESGSVAAPRAPNIDKPDRFNEILEILVAKLKQHLDDLKSQEKETTSKERTQEAITKDQRQREVIKEAVRTLLVRSLQERVDLRETLKITEWTKDQIEELAEQTTNVFFEGHSSYFSYLLNKQLTGVFPESE